MLRCSFKNTQQDKFPIVSKTVTLSLLLTIGIGDGFHVRKMQTQAKWNAKGDMQGEHPTASVSLPHVY